MLLQFIVALEALILNYRIHLFTVKPIASFEVFMPNFMNNKIFFHRNLRAKENGNLEIRIIASIYYRDPDFLALPGDG